MKQDHLKRGNMLWESSRMFLPEHKEQLLEKRRRQNEFVIPLLDEDQLYEINRISSEALHTKRSVVITHAGQYESERFCGCITRIDYHNALLRIEGMSETLILRFDHLLNVEWIDDPEP
jgi:hypothetical protein